MHSASGAPKAVANGILLYQCSETPTKQATRLFRFFMTAVARRVCSAPLKTRQMGPCLK